MYSSQATCLRYFACMNTNTDDLYQNVVEHKLLACNILLHSSWNIYLIAIELYVIHIKYVQIRNDHYSRWKHKSYNVPPYAHIQILYC